jgi:hypothetical protein
MFSVSEPSTSLRVTTASNACYTLSNVSKTFKLYHKTPNPTKMPSPIQTFLCFFFSCKANARVKLAKTGHGPHSSKLIVICVVQLLFVSSCVLFVCKCILPPGDNPIAINKYIILYIPLSICRIYRVSQEKRT